MTTPKIFLKRAASLEQLEEAWDQIRLGEPYFVAVPEYEDEQGNWYPSTAYLCIGAPEVPGVFEGLYGKTGEQVLRLANAHETLGMVLTGMGGGTYRTVYPAETGKVRGYYSIVIGEGATDCNESDPEDYGGYNKIAIGNHAVNLGESNVILIGPYTGAEKGTVNATCLGDSAGIFKHDYIDPDNPWGEPAIVSVGNSHQWSNRKARIINVADAYRDNDAVNLGQLKTKAIQRIQELEEMVMGIGWQRIWLTTPGTHIFTIPSENLIVSGTAAGGGGSFSIPTSNYRSSGGGGASVIRMPITAAVGEQVTITVGSPGVNSTTGINLQSDGGDTILFGLTLGGGKKSSMATPWAGGIGGLVSGGEIPLSVFANGTNGENAGNTSRGGLSAFTGFDAKQYGKGGEFNIEPLSGAVLIEWFGLPYEGA
jgi:hypothetical protein